ncbi:sigma54 specific transcriptional regulator, Fis family [Desulfobulbus propionicus DSM 2032]|uniref:Sigma54 specific transcriptional regulator, Fis family n=2 Tax=Desulfobulbus propionicus TaxID=894 RepID=A0A7U4DPR5_DESPD|nr:sigma54 specific transcriptional regulator, Fis family [Desulfobulbus propionicus DSM 2032]
MLPYFNNCRSPIFNLAYPHVSNKNVTVSNMQEEVHRLSTNWRTLLDAMPEMVFLLRETGEVEYMNRSAKGCFGFPCGGRATTCLREVSQQCGTILNDADDCDATEQGRVTETLIDTTPVEYSSVPFVGYTGEKLIMLVMRDITQRKNFERELLQFNTSIETILQQKISELQASEETRIRLSRQVNSLKTQLGFHHKADQMVGRSRKMRELREMIHQVAGSDATILITGESGTGKELVANLLKATSQREDKPFLKINCNAINDSLLEADLFGYEKGAFTGATARKVGKFEVVDGGTIFLDEIGDISPRMQVSLLRVLQNGEIIRVGGNEPIKVDVRVIAATNVDLAQAVKDKKFRLDLYYRLNIINIDIPPLRERKEDIVELVSFFVNHYREAFKKEIDFVPKSIINRLLAHDWPGNVRELENLIQRAVLMAKGKMITEADLIFDQDPRIEQQRVDTFNIDDKLGALPLKAIVADFEAAIIHRALDKYNGNVSTAATQLKLGKTALYDKMKQHGISAKHIKQSKRN